MWTIENDKEYTILSQLLFTDNNVKNEEAYFKDTVFSCISIRDIKTDTVWKSGERKAILLLKELITNNQTYSLDINLYKPIDYTYMNFRE